MDKSSAGIVQGRRKAPARLFPAYGLAKQRLAIAMIVHQVC
jgi:hypothetical protein